MSFVWRNSRHVTPEIMDKPDVAEAAHVSALEGLGRINRTSRAAEHIAKPIIEMARRKNLKKLSMLDIACGGGDVPIEVALMVRDAGVEIELTLLDRSATALRFAAEHAERGGIACKCLESDCTVKIESQFDVVTNSLFLHHIPEAGGVVDFLKNMRAMATRIVVISDLRRCWDGWMIAWTGSRILSRSEIVHFDAPVSVRAAWTLRELKGFAAEAQLAGARVERSWPWRMLLVWEAGGA
jgi:2-polyprenyl-3-methyl-5-hydroxy-6-metoxy-1,4-benzoquinol methylase